MCLQLDRDKLFLGGDSDRQHNYPILCYDLEQVQDEGTGSSECMPDTSPYKTSRLKEYLGHGDRIWTLQSSFGRLATGKNNKLGELDVKLL